MARPSPESIELVEYLVEACPGSLEKKAAGGCTPLMIACRLGRIDFVKILIAAGADQSTRDDNGENIVHAVIQQKTRVCRARKLLNLLDSDLRKHLFQQRRSLKTNGLTPLHAWILSGMYSYNQESSKTIVAMLKLILEYSNGEELEMLNGGGDTCLHSAVSQGQIAVIRTLVDFRPQLLYRENAVGRTPAEFARDRLASVIFKQPGSNGYHYYDEESKSRALSMKKRDQSEFFLDNTSQDEALKKQADEMHKASGLSETYTPHQLARILGAMGLDNPKNHDKGNLETEDLDKHVIWDLCSSAMRKHAGKRRLVSLNEANDVARRLGESETTSRYFSVNSRRDNDGEVSDKEEDDTKKVDDFVAQSLGGSTAWQTRRLGKEEFDKLPKCAICGMRHSDDE